MEEVRTVKLSEVDNMLRMIAMAMIAKHGEYLCMVNGEKVRVVK